MRNSWGAVVSRGDKVTLNTTVSGGDKPKVSYQLNIQTKFAKNTATEQVNAVAKESGEWKKWPVQAGRSLVRKNARARGTCAGLERAYGAGSDK